MRYAPAERLLRLARSLAATSMGLTLDEMAAELGVGRRTAERLCASLAAIFPQMTFKDDDERVRGWRLPGSALIGVVEPGAEVVAAVESAARDYEAKGNEDREELLRKAAEILRAVMNPDALRRATRDIAALMEAEGIAMRPGPRPLVAAGVLPTLQRAILAMQFIVVRYARTEGDEAAMRILCPYGILYGGRGWLVALVEGLPEMRLWRLDRIVSADLLDRNFSPREDFSLASYAAQSFGVLQEEPVDVELRFTPEAADDAGRWCLHPSQTTEREPDGSRTVRFHAGGMKEMCLHLLTCGETVSIHHPPQLQEMMAEMTSVLARHHSSIDLLAGASS